ncbi:MAG: histidine kinase [Bacteroidota bacterium]|nr:histidine kinase [Bacteroidota bacterium]
MKTWMKVNRKFVWVHIIAWLVYALFIYCTNLITTPKINFLSVVLFILPFALTFYCGLFFLGLSKKNGIAGTIVSFFLVFIILATIAYVYIYHLLPIWGVKVFTTTSFDHFIQQAIMGYVQYFAYAVLYFYVREAFKKSKELQALEKEKMTVEREKIESELEIAILKQQELKAQKEKIQYEYAFLRAQINPHFLHNTLNVLFSQAMDYSEDLADNILKLSRLMRYSLESLEYESGKVLVQKELEHLQTLLEINNMRFGNSKTIEYVVEGEVAGQMLPPLSIMTIVENAFKYGDLKDPLHPMLVKVVLKPHEIFFYCRNKKKKNNIQLSSSNIGLSNLTRRLDVTFPDKYNMRTIEEEEFYTFELNIMN